MGAKPQNTSIDRIDNDGHYSCGKCDECRKNGWPTNCHWATRLQQSQNTKSVIELTHNGETKCLREWARFLGLDMASLTWRIASWGVDKALSTPRRKEGLRKPTMVTFNGETLSVKEWSERLGISRNILHKRLKRWGVERALTTT